jgi:hypothetical protein
MLVPVVSNVVVPALTLDTTRVAEQLDSVMVLVFGGVVQDVTQSVWL